MNRWNRFFMQLLAFFLIIAIGYQVKPNPFALNDLSSIHHIVPVSEDNTLLKTIKEKSKEYEEPAENAKIHDVWKKMPGRNGIKVNIEASYKKMKEKGRFDETLLVYDQVKPEVTLKDLPPSPIYRGHPDKQMVAFLINVAWGEDNIPSILNTLKKQKVKATFFIEGKWASKNPDLVKMIQEEGHLIGNHAYNHPDMSRLGDAENREQIVKTNEILEGILGERPKWFAPPSGSMNDQVVKLAAEEGMETILWTVDTIDWKKPTTDVMVNRVMGKLHPGAMILMHPTDVIERGLEDLILNIKEKKYKLGTVARLLSEKRF
ncbi:polysaccharide deacetylase family protein [Radiobacillus deserti]|uniref:Polysaccharide deacetylase family protein n=1 Tax=Radiobacillus deserti TaxID=2594883 RepID=A0A516KFP8_9BACI|nr:polysaccharide deacetylase family protein [Radiobacillus deserti]QDP40223.1 polysaccharide deacetylase family protein [Radiobacillus deserti]